MATAADGMGYFVPPFTPGRCIRSLVPVIGGQHVLSRVVSEPLTLHALYVESCDTVVAAMTTGPALAAFRGS